jgi:hypothetical protein
MRQAARIRHDAEDLSLHRQPVGIEAVCGPAYDLGHPIERHMPRTCSTFSASGH